MSWEYCSPTYEYFNDIVLTSIYSGLCIHIKALSLTNSRSTREDMTIDLGES